VEKKTPECKKQRVPRVRKLCRVGGAKKSKNSRKSTNSKNENVQLIWRIRAKIKNLAEIVFEKN
jgi:hypothetical protein